MSTPLAKVKERFESKDKLVAAVKELATSELWLDRLSSDRSGSKGLEQVSNTKLLRLHRLLSEVKDQHGSRAKLVDTILETEGRTKDQGYRTRLEGYGAARLLDTYRSAKRRVAHAAKKVAG